MTVLGHRVIVREDALPNKIGRLFVPRSAKPATAMLPHTGIAMGVGNKVEVEVKVGDRVLMNRLAPMDFVEVKGEKCLVMREDDVMAVLE
jgi:co-chaperonin GroES (HSP10)